MLYRTVFLLPMLIPGIVIGAIWKLLSTTISASSTRRWARRPGAAGLAGRPVPGAASVIVVDIWHWTPFCFLLLLAGLESLPQEVCEAARIDGASGWQELRHVTLPMLRRRSRVTFLFRA